MRITKAWMPLVCLILALPGCADADNHTAAEEETAMLETEEQKTLYAVGVILSQNLGQLSLSDEELEIVKQGFTEGATGESQVDLQEYGPKVQALAQERAAAAAEEAGTEAMAFVDEQAAGEGASKTESGIVMTTITEGTGESPEATDRVQVHYHGTLKDGTVFDSSVDRGTPATFALNQVIPCWTESVQTMKVGGKARVVCPPNLAYGPQGRPGIPPNAALVFEIELLDIVSDE